MDCQKNNKVLIVEDSKLIGLVNSKLIKKHGYQCDIATDGIEAIDKYMHNDYVLILLDIDLPYIDGLKVYKAMKKYTNGKSIPPVISLTAHRDSIESECMDVGILEVIEKPLTTLKAKEIIDRWLKK